MLQCISTELQAANHVVEREPPQLWFFNFIHFASTLFCPHSFHSKHACKQSDGSTKTKFTIKKYIYIQKWIIWIGIKTICKLSKLPKPFELPGGQVVCTKLPNKQYTNTNKNHKTNTNTYQNQSNTYHIWQRTKQNKNWTLQQGKPKSMRHDGRLIPVTHRSCPMANRMQGMAHTQVSQHTPNHITNQNTQQNVLHYTMLSPVSSTHRHQSTLWHPHVMM